VPKKHLVLFGLMCLEMGAAPAAQVPLPGDVAHGEQVFWGKGQCGTCHMMNGRGALTAPDLSNIAGTRKASSIADALTKPQHRIYASGGAHLPALPAMDSYLPVYVTTADGKIIEGGAACRCAHQPRPRRSSW
jgi:mono/diheme cytochrome c family protein